MPRRRAPNMQNGYGVRVALWYDFTLTKPITKFGAFGQSDYLLRGKRRIKLLPSNKGANLNIVVCVSTLGIPYNECLSKISNWVFNRFLKECFSKDVLPNLSSFLLTLPFAADMSFSDVLYFLTCTRLSRLVPFGEPCGIIVPISATPFQKHENLIYVDLDCANLPETRYPDGRSALISSFQNRLISAVEKAVDDYIANNPSYPPGHLSDLHLSVLCLSFISLLISVSEHSCGKLRHFLALLVAVETRWELFAENDNQPFDTEPFEDLDIPLLLEIASRLYLTDLESCVLALRIVDIVCCTRGLHSTTKRSFALSESLMPQLLTTLQSPGHQARLHSLRILAVMFGVLRSENTAGENSTHAPVLTVLSRCLHAERVRLDAQSVREFLVPILHLHAHRDGINGQPVSAQIALSYLLGLLHVRLTSAWPGIEGAITSYAELPRARSDSRPESTNTLETNDQTPKESTRHDVSDDWRYVACRIYWCNVEPAIELSAKLIMDPASTHSKAIEDSVAQTDTHLLLLQTLCLQLMCHKLNAAQLPICSDQAIKLSQKPINWQDYHLALWRCLCPVSAGKKSRFLVPLLLQQVRWLQVALELFSKFHNIKSIYQESEFRSLMYDLLSNPRPSVQKAAFRCLLAYKDIALNNYSILYGRLQLSKGAFAPAIFTNLATCTDSEFSMFLTLLLQPLLEESVTSQPGASADAFSTTTDLCPFIQNLRVRVQTAYQSPNSLSWSQLQALAKVLNNVLDYMGHRLNKTDIPIANDMETTSIEVTVSDSPIHLDVLFRLGLSLIAMSQSASELLLLPRSNSNHTEHERAVNLPHPVQVKKVRAVGVRLLQHIFNSSVQFKTFFFTNGLLEAVRDVCLYPPMLSKLLNSSTVSTSHLLLTLALSWSTTPNLAANLLLGPGLNTLMSLLVTKKLGALVIERIIQVVCNLLFEQDVCEIGREMMRAHHGSLIQYLYDRMQQLSQSKSLLINRESKNQNHSLRLCQEFRILGYLATCAVHDQSSEDGRGSQISASQADSLLHGLLTVLTKCTIKTTQGGRRSTGDSAQHQVARSVSIVSAEVNELQLATADQVQADLIHAVTQLATITDNLEQHLKRILTLFVRIDSRVSRSLLCQSVESCTRRLHPIPTETLQLLIEISPNSPRRTLLFVNEEPNHCLPPYEMCSMILTRLNSWDKSRLDQPDIVQREHTFGLLSELCELLRLPESPCQSVYIHLGGLCCALHTLSHENLQLRDAALDYCLRLASAIAHSSSMITNTTRKISVFYMILIQRCLWPEVLRLLRDPRIHGPKRLHVLRLLHGVIDLFRSQRLFAPLSLLLSRDTAMQSSSTGTDFFTNLQSGAVSRQGQAIRRLALFLRNPLTIVAKKDLIRVKKILDQSDTDFPVPERLLCDFFVPLLFFYLNPHLVSNLGHEDLLWEQRRLVDFCLDALGAVAHRLSWNAYRKLMDSTLSKLKNAGNVGFAARVITCLIDAFAPPQWTSEVARSIHSGSRCTQASFTTTTTDLPLDFSTQSEEPATDTYTHTSIVQTPVTMDKVNQTQRETPGDNQATILSYMLQVVKRLQPFITKCQKSEKDAPGQGPKRCNISLVVSLVSLLKRLPSGFLVSRLPGLILQVVTLLRPSSTSTPKVRAEALKSLIQVVRVLGPGKPLEVMVSIVSQQLNRGYASLQVRLFTLHKILGEIESYLSGGSHSGVSEQLDHIGSMISAHYLDELVGTLAEEIDSRRAAGYSLSSTSTVRVQDVTDLQTSTTGLGGSNSTDLPEANGLKAPEGLSRLCRLLSDRGIQRLFDDLENAVISAASGSAPNSKTNESSESVSSLVGCGLRYRSRALARLEVTMTRLPTRSGLFSLKRCGQLTPLNLLSLSSQLIQRNLRQVISANCVTSTNAPGTANPSTPRSTHGWKQPQSNLLEPRWSYLELESEPKRDRASDTVAQSGVTQAHLLVSCGLHILVGLLRYRCLNLDNAEQMDALATVTPLILECMRSKYVRVLGAALRCLNLLLTMVTSKVSSKLQPSFSVHMKTAGDRLFTLMSIHPGLLSTKTAATDPYAQQFASSLYRALSALIRHQSTYPLSSNQLLTLLNAVDIELTRDAAATPSLSLLQAILQRRLRDPSLQAEEKSYLSFTGDIELQTDGLVVAKLSDSDQLPTCGAGGGARLVDLIQRLQTLAITSSSEHIRAEARCCLVLFLLNYPHKAKFVQSFVAFCLRQLEYKKSSGRSSALSLLTGLTADLPVSRLSSNHLEETILLSVGAAIEREPVRALRVGMLALIRLLFSRLPAALAEMHFRQYLLAFVTAPAATRTSARLLGLQLVAAVLDCQPCLSLAKHRPMLVKLLGTDVLPTASLQLYQVVITNESLREVSGLNPLFFDKKLCPTEEIARARAALEDASWVAELKGISRDSDGSDEEDSDDKRDDDNNNDEDAMQRLGHDSDTAQHSEDEDADADMDAQTDRNEMHFEKAEAEARDQCESLVPDSDTNVERTSSRSAQENHYLLVSNTLEYSLRFLKRLLDFVDETMQPSEDIYAVSDSMIPAWSVITGYRVSPSDEDITGAVTSKRRRSYAQLLDSTRAKLDQTDRLSLCCSGHRGAREWATQCLGSLLRVESNANSGLLNSENVENTEAAPGAGLTRSAFFNRLRKKRKTRIALLVANLVHLGQLLHLSAGRRPVLRLLRHINRIALDELNNRPGCYFQRALVLKVTTGLLLRLPRPKTDDLVDLFTRDPSNHTTEAKTEIETGQPRCLAYVSYLRAASRVIAREFRQRDRLAFMSAATITGALTNDEDQESVARARLGGVKLSKEQSVRARARRRKSQARLRRTLMSGTMRPETAQRMIALTAASRARAGPDQLINVIEAAESTLIGEYGVNGAKLMQAVCGQATRGARARHQAHAVKIATKEALGAAWNENGERKRSKHDQPTAADTGPKRAFSGSESGKCILEWPPGITSAVAIRHS
ncbi:hypothetical protein D915_010516 [Fasciola hepatica]|uniref:HEAT repeat protein n=1 Tax=Fasciola hepatica TaxID=6192 RepID=A0A4E0QTT6_FASHE|nr:hypothetical protein D915_010516 [Fasciola hepatica]